MLNSPFVTISFCIFQPFTNHMMGCVFDFLSLPNWWKTLIVLHRQCVGHGECCFSYMVDLLYSNINEWRGILNALTIILGLFVVFLQNFGQMLSAIADHSLFNCLTYFFQHTQYYIGCSTWTSQAQSHNPRCPFDLSIFTCLITIPDEFIAFVTPINYSIHSFVFDGVGIFSLYLETVNLLFFLSIFHLSL